VPDSWERISEIFHSALACSPAEREVFLDAACKGDADLRRQVQSLLAYEGRSDEFLEPASQAGSLIGRTFGVYEVLSEIGAGGMGVVYRARDRRLGRDVALKVLPPDMLDSGRRARFQREAQVLATLNHPHIATIYGMEEVDGVSALVLELIDGSTLAELIRQGPVPVPRALTIARQIADALKAAHARGVVHRDLKPANIGITQDGTVKVLDFGLAKTEVAASSGRAGATTIGAAAATVMLGTPGYMSPEQARGVGVDTKTDIWAFGCVCYEMLAGRPAFDGATVMDILAAVIEKEPDWKALPNALSDDVRDLLRRCLSKDPSRRPTDVSAALGPTPTRGETSLARIAIAIATLLVAGLLAVSPMSKWLARSDEEELVPVPLTSYPGLEDDPSFSPDGTQVAFSWNGPSEDNIDIYTKSIGAGEPHKLTTDPGIDGTPYWSPDGQWIVFKRAAAADPELPPTVYVMPASGGVARPIGPGFPQGWSPDSKWLLISRGPGTGRSPGLWLVSPTTAAEQQLTSRPLSQLDWGRLSLDGRVLAVRRTLGATSIATLLVQPLSAELKIVGTARELPVDRRIRLIVDAPIAWVGSSKEIVYSAGWGASYLWRVSADAASRPVKLAFAGDAATDPAISMDGRRLAFAKSLDELNIWSLPLDASRRAAGPPVHVFDSSSSELCPAFSPDGTRVAFESVRSGSSEIWTCASDGSACTQLTSFGGPHAGSPSWSPDGQQIAFDAAGENGSETYVISADGGKPTRVAAGAVPRWSKDGQWIYYSGIVAANPPQLLYRIPSTGGQAQPVESARGGWVPQPTDDGALYYSMNPNAARTRIYRVSGNTSTQVLSDVAGRNFIVTNDGIWYFKADALNARMTLHQPAELHFYDFASRMSRTVYRTERPVGPGMALSPDGGRLLFTLLDRWGKDLMLVDHFR